MIETERLLLRPCREADKPGFATVFNTPAMMAELGGVSSAAEVNALVKKRMADQARDGYSIARLGLTHRPELDFTHAGYGGDGPPVDLLVFAVERPTPPSGLAAG
ncbi:hypothetical protein BH11PSE2_BH11PSE2_18690 [soil metagenome]